MWKQGNFCAEGKSTSMNSYFSMMHDNSFLSVRREIHVLLVDHEPDSLRNTTKLLEMCEYKVTLAEHAFAAVSTLSNGKVNFDIIMADIQSPDLYGFNLLSRAVNMDIPIILMSVDENIHMANWAIEHGAFLYIKKPTTTELLRCLWQHVAREKTRERERLIAANYSVHGIEFREVAHHSDENPYNIDGNNIIMMKDKGKRKRTYNYKGRKGDDGEEECDSENNLMSQGRIRRKVCTEWTQELHQKFMEAVDQLGEGRCFPKEILEIMNEPGLTRMQVASHLQKCRNDNWRSLEERKSSLAAHSLSSNGDGSQHKPRRFGSMPRLGKAPSYNVQVNQNSGGGQGSETQFESKMANDGDVDNMGTGPIIASSTTTTTTYHNQHYTKLIPHPSNVEPSTSSSQPRHPSAGNFYGLQDMDRLISIPSLSSLPQGSLGMNHPHSSTGGYNLEIVYDHDQNAKVPSMDNMSQWTNSETSNFMSDNSETRGN